MTTEDFFSFVLLISLSFTLFMTRRFILNGCIGVAMRIVVERLVEVAITSTNIVVDVSTVVLIVYVLFYTRYCSVGNSFYTFDIAFKHWFCFVKAFVIVLNIADVLAYCKSRFFQFFHVLRSNSSFKKCANVPS